MGRTISAAAGWALVAILLLLYAVCFLDRVIISLMVDAIKADLGVSDFRISLLQGFAFAIFYAVMGIPFGWAADRFPRRWVIFGGVIAWSLATMFCGLAQRFWQLMLARFGVGAGEAALLPAGFSMLADSFPPQRLALATSVFTSGAMIGTGVAIGIGGALIASIPADGLTLPVLGSLRGWQAVFLLAGVPGLVLAGLIFLVREPRRQDTGRVQPRPAEAFAQVRRHWRFYAGHWVGFGLISACGYGALLWLPSHLARSFRMDMTEMGLALALVSTVPGLIGSFLAGAVADAWFRRGRHDAHLRLYALGGLVQAGLVIAAMNSASATTCLMIYALAQLFNGFAGVAAAAMQIVTPAPLRGQVSSAYLLVFTIIGLGCGPSITAAFTDYLYGDARFVGAAIATTYAVLMPLAVTSLWLAGAPMRRLVAARNDN